MVKAVIHFGTHNGSQLLFVNGTVYEGIGPRQTEIKPTMHGNLKAIRYECGDDEIGMGLPETTMCYVYDTVDGDFVVVAEIGA